MHGLHVINDQFCHLVIQARIPQQYHHRLNSISSRPVYDLHERHEELLRCGGAATYKSGSSCSLSWQGHPPPSNQLIHIDQLSPPEERIIEVAVQKVVLVPCALAPVAVTVARRASVFRAGSQLREEGLVYNG